MSTTSLYNKYRPYQFGQVKQAFASRVLRSQVLADKYPNAYLLQGPAGTGKTTLARIMASAMLCDNRNNDGEPCGECQSCKLTRSGKNRDVMEENCADNSGIDDIRSIIDERLRIAPSIGKYRIFILDEVQRLSRDAQGAMLKHLEEPPAYVKFFLCTTDPEKLLPALQTRCQRHVLKPVSEDDLVDLLKDVSDQEGIVYDNDGLRMIAESSQGSARQALVYLEHAATIESATTEAVGQVLGRGPVGFCRDLLNHVIDCEDVAILQMLDVVKTEGLDRVAIASECLRLLMSVQRAKTLGESLDSNPILEPLAQRYKKGSINAVAQYLVESLTHMRGGGVIDDAVLQMNLLRASEFVRVKRAEAATKNK